MLHETKVIVEKTHVPKGCFQIQSSLKRVWKVNHDRYVKLLKSTKTCQKAGKYFTRLIYLEKGKKRRIDAQ